METTLNERDQAELVRLLRHVVEEDGGFIPDVAYRQLHGIVPWPAVEVLIYDQEGRCLLTYRDDDFKGWHIPGGYMKPGEGYLDACHRHVRKENIVRDLKYALLIASYAWRHGEHPFGYPLSLICACRAEGEISERPDLKWFREIPHDLIPQHRPFLKYFQGWFVSVNRSAATILL